MLLYQGQSQRQTDVLILLRINYKQKKGRESRINSLDWKHNADEQTVQKSQRIHR